MCVGGWGGGWGGGGRRGVGGWWVWVGVACSSTYTLLEYAFVFSSVGHLFLLTVVTAALAQDGVLTKRRHQTVVRQVSFPIRSYMVAERGFVQQVECRDEMADYMREANEQPAELELPKVCDGILALTGMALTSVASAGGSKEFQLQTKGDYYRCR